MLHRIKSIRNIGQFDNVTPPDHLFFNRFTLLYGENGGGKTTLSSILRSLRTGDPIPITDRRRLGTTDQPFVIFEQDGPILEFKNEKWSNTLRNLKIFDDSFISNNVCSGLEVDSDQRRGLHELILGERGVVLYKEFENLGQKVKEHNDNIKIFVKAIPAMVLGPYKVEEFCLLKEDKKIDDNIKLLTQKRDTAISKEKNSR